MIFKLFIIFFSAIFAVNSFAQDNQDIEPAKDLGCLEHEWQQISPSEADKKFDMANDFDFRGKRISCRNYITPTELDAFFQKVKKATRNKDKEALADLIKFPTRTLLDGMEDVPKGTQVKANSRPIKNKAYFIEHYDEIMLPTTIKIIQCMQLNNIFAHSYMGTATKAGEFWFYRDYDTRQLSISRLSSSPIDNKHWLDKKCSWRKIKT